MIKLLLMMVAMPVVGRFPRFFYRLAEPVGWLLATLQPGLRKAVTRNVAPFCMEGEEPASYVTEVVRNVIRYYVDMAALPYRDMDRYEERHIRVENAERLALVEDPDTPTIVVAGHTGNPEPVIAALAKRGRDFVALVEPLEPEALSKFVQKRRNDAGGKFVEADFSGIRTALKALHRNEVVAVVADRDIHETGVCIEFAGRKVKLPSGPWELARRTGATIVPAFTSRLSFENQSVRLEEPFVVPKTRDAEADIARAATQWAALLEVHIRRNPGQWAVLEDFWEVHRCG